MSSHGKEVPFAFLFRQMFHFLLATLTETAQRCGQNPLRGHGLPAILALAEQARIDACQRFPDVPNELPVPVAHDQRDEPVQFDGRPVKRIRQLHALFLHFLNHFIARPLQLIHLTDQDILDILDLFPLHLSSSITWHTYPFHRPSSSAAGTGNE